MKQPKDKEEKAGAFKFPKSVTGIKGLDDITHGGIPKERTTLILGGAGCGKTIFAMEFLVNGIKLLNEPGVFLSFEEKTSKLVANSKSLDYNLDKLVGENKLYLESLQINRYEILKAGKYDLEGLFIRLEQAINKVKAKRVVLDSLDALFFGLDSFVLRAEFKRLLIWLKEKQVTAIITAEVGDGLITRHGLEEHVADCVMILSNRTSNQIATRRIRIIKYRGSLHGNNEYPFVIDETGISVFPLVSEAVQQKSGTNRISSGVKDLDEMLGKKGFYVGSSILISGTAGTGKTSIAASFAHSVCSNNKRCLFCAFEEAPNQVIRNMRSIGFQLEPLIKSGMLSFIIQGPLYKTWNCIL